MKFRQHTHRVTQVALSGLLLLLSGTSGALGAVDAAADEGNKGLNCYPDKDGRDPRCDQAPVIDTQGVATGVLSWNQTPGTRAPKPAMEPDRGSQPEPSGPQPPEPAAEDAALTAAEPPVAEATQVTTQPPDGYTPTAPREAAPGFHLADNLAADLYVRDEDATGLCPGGYVIRSYPYAADADNENFPIVAEADSLSAEIDIAAQLRGDVSIEQGNRLIHAPQVDLDQPSGVATFAAGARIDQPGLIMQANAAQVHLQSKQADLSETQFIITDVSLRGRAEQLEQNPSGDLTLQRAGITRCEPDYNGWRLHARHLVIKKDEVFGTAKHAVLKLKSVPVFYTPYLKFPVSGERVSGFLFPNIAHSEEDGADVSLPYYINLAPNYDATFVPRYVGRRGTGAELELRHKSAWQDTVLGGALLPEDDLFNGTLSREDFDQPQFDNQGNMLDPGAFAPADRWLGALDHRGRIGRFRTFADVTMVSDADYFRDLGSDLGVTSQVELERRGEIQYNYKRLFVRLWGQRFQRLDDIRFEDYQRLPELEMRYRAPLGPLEVSLGATWADFDRDTEGLSGRDALTGERTHIEPRVRLPLSWPFGFFTASAGYRYTHYELEQHNVAAGARLLDETPDRGIGTASLDGGLIFERELNWFKQNLTHTLEPRLYYLWQEFDNQDDLPRFDASDLTFGYQQLFRGNRFSGLDRIGDANQASAGVTTRFLATDTGREYFSFSIGEIFYFQDREVTLGGRQSAADRQSSSAVAAGVSARLWGNWRLTGTTVWDPHDNEVDEGGAALQYRRDNRHIFNLGFRNRRIENIEQTDVSLYWPITRKLSVIGRWNYDLVSGRTVEGFGGIEYSNCCLQVRLVHRRFLESPASANFTNVDGDEGVFLQIVFKGLAGFGTKTESVLERGIRGYRAPAGQGYFANNRDI